MRSKLFSHGKNAIGTRFKTLDEFYQAIRELISWLDREGHPDEAQRLNALMNTAWTTGSELIGELERALRKMKGKYSTELQGELVHCLQFARHYRRILRLD